MHVAIRPTILHKGTHLVQYYVSRLVGMYARTHPGLFSADCVGCLKSRVLLLTAHIVQNTTGQHSARCTVKVVLTVELHTKLLRARKAAFEDAIGVLRAHT